MFGRSVVAMCALLLASGRAQQQQQSSRTPQFENGDVRVWKSLVMPNGPLAMHRHDHPRIAVALTGGDLKYVDEKGGEEINHWETGKAYWLPAMPPGRMHADVNAGDKPLEVMMIELKNAR